MFSFFKRDKLENFPVDAALHAEYTNLQNKYRNNPSLLEKEAIVFIEQNNYSNPDKWLEALALCDIALERKELTDDVKELYRQLYRQRWNEHVSVNFDDTDYEYWFDLCKTINNRFIEAGFLQAWAEQADLLQTARRPHRDVNAAKECLLKGIEEKDPASMAGYAYGLYFGMDGHEKADKEEARRIVQQAIETGYESAYLLSLIFDFYEIEDNNILLDKIQTYIENAPAHRKGYYLLVDYYLQKSYNFSKALEAMEKGKEHRDYGCYYQLGMCILRGQIEDREKSEGIALLAEAYTYGVINAANFLGQYYYYAKDENTSVEKAIEWHEKGVVYYSSYSAFELALIYLYNEEVKDLEKGVYYLDIAIGQDYPRAMNEKAYLLLESSDFENNASLARELLEKSMELGDDYAPYRLGLAIQNGEFGDERDYEKALELYELAASRGCVYGMELAGHYYRVDIVSEDENNGVKAVDYFNQAIERNSNYARVELALCYEYGTGVEQDYQKAFELYNQAAENNYTYANIKLGYYWEDALHGQEDLTKSLENFEIAAEAGYPEGMYNAGRFYKYAVGVPENPERAMEYFHKAAEGDYTQAYIELALAYEREYAGTEFDGEKAMEYMMRAAEAGFPFAQYKVGYYYYYGLVGSDVEKGLEWFMKSYEQGYPHAAIMIGNYYLYNYGGSEPDYDKAFEFYKFAEQHGYISEGLGICYEYGLGVEENNTEAFKYYTLAADNEYTAAKYRLGLCFKYGTGTAVNMVDAYKWFAEAAEEGNQNAQYEAAILLLEGNEISQDSEKAVKMLMEIAEDDHDDAQYELGNCYLLGKGVEADEEMAMVWYQRAAENGNEQAMKLTGKRQRRKR